MEFPLKSASTGSKALAQASDPKLRLFKVQHVASDFERADVLSQSWVPSSREAAADFSAVAWYFAQQLRTHEHLAVGVIEADWGGTPAEAWTSPGALGNNPSLAPVWSHWGALEARQVDDLKREALQKQAIIDAEAAHLPAPAAVWYPELRSQMPGSAFNGMIAPLTPYAIKGIIWYQGEGNAAADQAAIYEPLFRVLIGDWRARWGLGDLPFLYVQISSFDTGAFAKWPEVREAQRRTLSLKGTGMVVTIDVGNLGNIHPTNKEAVGQRLARVARALVYHESVVYSGPLFRQAYLEGSEMLVFFDFAHGLRSDNGPPTGFEVLDASGIAHPAQAVIEGDHLRISSREVKFPKGVRYGWANAPRCNLYNDAGLPASPFQSE